MKKMTLLWAVFVCFMTSLSAQDFEGIIEMVQITPTGIEYNMKWYIKNKQIAYELSFENGRGMYQIRFVPKKSTNSMLMVTAGTKTEIPISEIKRPEGFSMEGAKIVDLGVSKSTSFKEVNNWELTTKNITSSLEVTTDIDINFTDYKEFFKNDYGLCALIESGQPGFLLNSTTLDNDGKLITTTSLKKVTRTDVADSFFM